MDVDIRCGFTSFGKVLTQEELKKIAKTINNQVKPMSAVEQDAELARHGIKLG